MSTPVILLRETADNDPLAFASLLKASMTLVVLYHIFIFLRRSGVISACELHKMLSDWTTEEQFPEPIHRAIEAPETASVVVDTTDTAIRIQQRIDFLMEQQLHIRAAIGRHDGRQEAMGRRIAVLEKDIVTAIEAVRADQLPETNQLVGEPQSPNGQGRPGLRRPRRRATDPKEFIKDGVTSPLNGSSNLEAPAIAPPQHLGHPPRGPRKQGQPLAHIVRDTSSTSTLTRYHPEPPCRPRRRNVKLPEEQIVPQFAGSAMQAKHGVGRGSFRPGFYRPPGLTLVDFIDLRMLAVDSESVYSDTNTHGSFKCAAAPLKVPFSRGNPRRPPELPWSHSTLVPSNKAVRKPSGIDQRQQLPRKVVKGRHEGQRPNAMGFGKQQGLRSTEVRMITLPNFKVSPGALLQLGPASIHLGYLLGKGAFGSVVYALAEFGQKPLGLVKPKLQMAIKIEHASSQGATGVKEGRALKKLRGTGCAPELYMELTTETEHFLFMEYAEAELEDFCDETRSIAFVDRLAHIRSIFRDLLHSLDKMHKAGIVHRDIKPPNILFRRGGQPIFGDVGMAHFLADGPLCAFVAGTSGYIAPELLVNDNQPVAHPTAIDIYSLGITLLACLGVDVTSTFDAGKELGPWLHIVKSHHGDIIDDLESFLHWVLHPIPSERPTAQEALNHPFLATGPILRWLPEMSQFCEVKAMLACRSNKTYSFKLKQQSVPVCFFKDAIPREFGW